MKRVPRGWTCRLTSSIKRGIVCTSEKGAVFTCLKHKDYFKMTHVSGNQFTSTEEWNEITVFCQKATKMRDLKLYTNIKKPINKDGEKV